MSTNVLTTELPPESTLSLSSLLSTGSLLVPDPLNTVIDSALRLPASSSTSITETITALDDIQGTLTLVDGFLTANLATPFGPVQDTIDALTLATELSQSFEGISGTLNLLNGTASGNLTIGNQNFIGSFEFANLIGNFVSDFVATLSGTASFANGQIAIDLPTAIGEVAGTIGFGSGAFVVDLSTPLGAIDFSLDFPDDAQYSIPIPQLSGAVATVDLAGGELEIDVLSILPGAEIVLPLTSLAGTVAFASGLATVSVNSPFGAFNFQFDLAEEAGEELTEFLTSVTGTLGIGSGQLSANLATGFGAFAGVLNPGQLFTDLIALLPQTQGTLTLENGLLSAALLTPSGTIAETIDYGQYVDDIVALVD